MLNQISKELNEFKQPIVIIKNWLFNQKDTIEQCILYFNSKFVDGEYDSKGFKKYFYNICRAACGTTTKAIDIDTKDILLLTAPGGNSLLTWFYQRDLKNWMKTKEFGKILNRISDELPKFGSVVLKVVGDEIFFVDLRNFICEQNADSLDLSNYIIEQHLYTRPEFRKEAKIRGWDNVSEVMKLYEGSNSQYIRVFERYGEVENKDGLSDYKMVLVADIPGDIKDNDEGRFAVGSGGVILAEKLIDRHPYIEIHLNKIPGRWLGVGTIETLFDPQIRLNEITNQEVKSTRYSTLRLWQSRDTGVVRNLLTDVDDGEILNVEEEIAPVDMADRNVTQYLTERQKWEQNAQQQTFSYDVIRGERTPAGTPLGSAQLSAAMTMSFFDHVREEVALGIKSMLYNYVLPAFKKEADKEHILRITGEDLDKLNSLVIENTLREKMFSYLKNKKRLPSQEMMKLWRVVEEESQKSKKEQMVKIEDGFYKDVKYEVDIVITGESRDAKVMAQNLFSALQAITVDPTLLTDPTKRKIFAKYLEQGGISLSDLEAEIISKPAIDAIPQGKGMGGGVSAATPIQGGLGQAEQVI